MAGESDIDIEIVEETPIILDVVSDSPIVLELTNEEQSVEISIIEDTPIELDIVEESPIVIELKETGAKGDDGDDGDAGEDGISAYQVWLNLGNTGTEQDFIDSLQGAKGDDGDDGTVPDVAWTEYDLDGKVIGSVPIGHTPDYIEESICRLYLTKNGRLVTGVGILYIPYDADWGAASPFFPIRPISILSSDLPFMPKIYPVIPEIFGNAPTIGTFSIINCSESDSSSVEGDAFAIGSVVTDFGGQLTPPIFTFFHTKPTAGQIENLVQENQYAELMGRNVLIYIGVKYEEAEPS